MKAFNWLLVAAAIFLKSSTAHAATDEEAQQAIRKYVQTHQSNSDISKNKNTKIIRARTRKYPVVAKLGLVVSETIVDRNQFAGTEIFTAKVHHTLGTSKWQFRLAQDGINIAAVQLMSADFDEAAIIRTKGKWRYFGGFRPSLGHYVGPNPTGSHTVGMSRDPCIEKPEQCSTAANNPNDPRIVEFLYATDRKLNITNNVATLADDSNRSGKLSFGVAAVRIPEDHEEGLIELPSEWRLFGFTYKFSPKDKKHFVVRHLTETSLEDWKGLAQRHQAKSAIIFVHGFNTNFKDALYRNAQITWDLQFDGLSVLYSWSSKGETADYLYDRDSAEIAEQGFIDLLNILQNEIGIEHVSVIAHSMGNRIVLNALRNNANTAKPVALDQLVMAAPDIASDDFANKLPVVRKLTNGATLYASSADKALKLSGKLANFPRAGDVPASGPVVLPKLDTIDVTKVGDDVFGLNHNVFASNRSVMDDIKLLVIKGMPLPRLTQVRHVPEPPALPTYWQFR